MAAKSKKKIFTQKNYVFRKMHQGDAFDLKIFE